MKRRIAGEKLADSSIRPRWGLIVAVTVAGLAVTAAPFLLTSIDGQKFGDDQALTSSTLTNIGTTLLLAAVLFGLERTFLKRVTNATATNVKQVVEERTAHLAQANQELAARLATLTAEVEERLAADAAERGASVANIANAVTFDTVAEAMEQANGLNALWRGTVTVPADRSPRGPKVTFDWRARDYYDDNDRLQTYDAIRLTFETVGEPPLLRSRTTEVNWFADESIADVMSGARTELMKAGRGSAARAIDDTHLFSMFQLAISLALKEREGHEDFWVRGALHELISEDIAITSEGVCARDYSFVPSANFPDQPGIFGKPILREPHYQAPPNPPPFPPPPPAGVSGELWALALRQAQTSHPRRLHFGNVSGIQGGHPAHTPESSPRPA